MNVDQNFFNNSIHVRLANYTKSLIKRSYKGIRMPMTVKDTAKCENIYNRANDIYVLTKD